MDNEIKDINEYLKEIGEYPVLTDAETIALQKNLKSDETPGLKLYHSHQRLVVSIAKKYMHRDIDTILLIEEGNTALKKAILTFANGAKFNPADWYSWYIHLGLALYIVKVCFPQLQAMIIKAENKDDYDGVFEGIFLRQLLAQMIWKLAWQEKAAKDYTLSALESTFADTIINSRMTDNCFVFKTPFISQLAEIIELKPKN